MLDGPKIGLLVLAIVLPLVVLGIYLVERRHSGRGRRHDREPQRLPLFGTEQLSIRTLDGTIEDDTPSRPVPPALTAEPRRSATPRETAPPLTTGDGRPSRAPALAPAPPPVSAATRAPRDSFRPTAASAVSAMVATPTAEHPVPTARQAAPSARVAAAPAAPLPPAPSGMADLALIEGETLRFTIPRDGAVEFLPGWLEIVAGPEAGREIRFVRAPGEVDVEVTFGRSEGPPNRHVQILARTVSRRHAVMSLIDEHWQLTNLSSTNPVVLNGRVLAGNEVAPLLVEGDRIEMGEVAFVFHDG